MIKGALLLVLQLLELLELFQLEPPLLLFRLPFDFKLFSLFSFRVQNDCEATEGAVNKLYELSTKRV